MSKHLRTSAWARVFQRSFAKATRRVVKSATRAVVKSAKRAIVVRSSPPPGAGNWTLGVAAGPAGVRRFRLYRPPDIGRGERLPLLVMLHGCGQDANGFATSTRMNRLAMRQRFLVLYPEQDRLANAQGCWNWFDTASGRADGEAALIMLAIDQVCLSQPVDGRRIAIAGLSAGASMAALLVTRHPARFRALVMHSGIPPGTAHSPLSALGAMHGRRGTRPLVATPLSMVAWPPLLVIHGDADHTVAPKNALAAVQLWAAAAGAQAATVRRVQRGQRYPMAVTDYRCQGRTVATLALVGGLAHAWSGGLTSKPFGDGRGPDASAMIWAFAARQFRQ
ncbi:MAG: phospholipase [Betaproteobacteria bacterium HGW-Betaproteobacteria-12]|nr:MAG: phospholipase [Betaproteobacteria bacterium HGW-Betaproteobacteria-12]